MTFIAAKRIAAMALESTSGTAATVANSDFNIHLRGITFDPEVEMFVRDFASGRHSQQSAIPGKRKASFEVIHDLRCGAAAGTAPLARKLFLSAGATETIVSSTSVAYTPLATKDEGDSVTSTWKIMETPTSGNALIYTIKGAMANGIIGLDELGNPLYLKCMYTGAFVSIADGTLLTLTSPDTSVPVGSLAATITHASTAQKIGKFELDFGNDIQMDYDPSDSTGYKAAYIAARKPKLSINPKAELVATDAHYTRWVAGTEAAFSFATATSGGLKWTVAAPKAQLITNKVGDRNGAIIWDQQYDLHESTGNDEWSITQSA